MRHALVLGRRNIIADLKRKTQNQGSTITTLASDLELSVLVLANDVVEFEFIIFHSGNTTGDLGGCVVAPTGSTGYWGYIGTESGGGTALVTQATNVWTASKLYLAGNKSDGTSPGIVTIRGLCIVGADGVFELQFAQQNGPSGTTTVLAGSFLSYIVRRQ